jgi:hypothetical protein
VLRELLVVDPRHQELQARLWRQLAEVRAVAAAQAHPQLGQEVVQGLAAHQGQAPREIRTRQADQADEHGDLVALVRRQPGPAHALRDHHAQQGLVQGPHVDVLVHPALAGTVPGPLGGLLALDAGLQAQDADLPGVAALHLQEGDGDAVAVHGVHLEFGVDLEVADKLDVGLAELHGAAGEGLGGAPARPGEVAHGHASVVDHQALPVVAAQVLGQGVDHELDHLGLENAVGDAAGEVLAAGDAGGEAVPGVEVQGGHVLAALRLGHVLGAGHVRVVVKGEDHARHAPLKVLVDVPVKLALDVLLPGEDLLDSRGHQADLAVHEHRVGPEGRAGREGPGDLLLEAGDPRGVYGHGRGVREIGL